MACGRAAGQPGNALADEVLHALGDVGLLEEGRPVTLGADQLIELLDLVAELDGQGIRLELAGVADGFHLIVTSIVIQCARLSAPAMPTQGTTGLDQTAPP